jgi:predicted negative regulator of RcsB-dependent stress response
MSSDATQTMTVYDLLAWLEANKKGVIAGLIAAIVIGFGVYIYSYNADQKELAASDALLKLRTSVGGVDVTNPPAPAEYLRVAEAYPGTSAAERAVLLAASALFTQGKYADAQTEFTKFLRDRPQSPFAASAAYGVAASEEAQGKADEALTGYQNLSVRYPNSSVLEDAKLATARLYEAKKQPEQALRVYDELLKSPGMGSASSEAMMRKEDLLARHPELAKTNAPPAAPTVVVPATNAPVASTNSASAAPKASTAPTQPKAAPVQSPKAAPVKP